jgi:hypothetical protein
MIERENQTGAKLYKPAMLLRDTGGSYYTTYISPDPSSVPKKSPLSIEITEPIHAPGIN